MTAQQIAEHIALRILPTGKRLPTSVVELRRKIAIEIYPDVMRSLRVDELEYENRG